MWLISCQDETEEKKPYKTDKTLSIPTSIQNEYLNLMFVYPFSAGKTTLLTS